MPLIQGVGVALPVLSVPPPDAVCTFVGMFDAVGARLSLITLGLCDTAPLTGMRSSW